VEGAFADDGTSGSIQLSCLRGVSGGSLCQVDLCRGRAPGAVLRKSFVEMGTVRCCPLKPIALSHVNCDPGDGVEDCITSARLRWLRLLSALVVVRLVVVPLPPRSPRRRWRVVGWADILLDAIGGVEREMREGCPRTMTGVSQYWFSGHFRQVFSTPMHHPALTLAPTCGGNRAS